MRFLVFSVLLASCCPYSDAATLLAFSVDGGIPSGSSSLSIDSDVNDVVTVSVFLIDTNGTASLSSFGLGSAGFTANFHVGLGEASNVQLGSGWETQFTPIIDVNNPAGLVRVSVVDDFVTAGNPGQGTGAQLIASFDYLVTSLGSTTFTLVDPNPAPTFADNVLNDIPNFTDLDPTIFASAPTLTINAVPTPSTPIALASLALLGVNVRGRRPRRKSS